MRVPALLADLRRRGRTFDPGPSSQHGIDRGRMRGRAPGLARAQLLGHVAAKLDGGERPQRAGVGADPVPLLGETPAQRRP